MNSLHPPGIKSPVHGKEFSIGLSSSVFFTSGITGLIATVWFLLLIALAFTMEQFLPPRYFYDSTTILSLYGSTTGLSVVAGSFPNTAALFEMLGFNELSAPVIGVTSIAIVLVLAYRRSRLAAIPLAMLLFAGAWSIIMTIYMGQLSKDFLVLMMVALLLLVRTRRQLAFWLILAVVYAAFFRVYWILIVGLFIGATIASRWIRTKTGWLIFSLAVYGAMAFAFDFVLGRPLTYAREAVNLERASSPDALTMIVDLVQGDGLVVTWLNATLSTALLLFPVRLVLFGGIQHILTFLLISLSAFVVFRSEWILRTKKVGTGQTRWVFMFLWSFLMTQGLFEPDYGSFLRHLSPVAPLIVFVWARSRAAAGIHA